MANKMRNVNCDSCGAECANVGKNTDTYCGAFIKAVVKPAKKAKYRADAEHEFCNQPRTKRVIKEAVNNKIIEEEKW